MRLLVGNEHRDVSIRQDKDGPVVTVGGRVFRPVVEETGPGRFVVQEGLRSETFYCIRDGATVHLAWRGVVYVLTEEREGSRAEKRQTGGALEAPMPGKVIAVRVVPGQAVRKGDEMLVIEAMKMENALRVPRDGVVKTVAVAVGDMVSPGTVLVELLE